MKELFFPVIITALFSIMGFTFLKASNDLEAIAKSVRKLNESIGILITKGEYRDEKLKDHESRIRIIENVKEKKHGR